MDIYVIWILQENMAGLSPPCVICSIHILFVI